MPVGSHVDEDGRAALDRDMAVEPGPAAEVGAVSIIVHSAHQGVHLRVSAAVQRHLDVTARATAAVLDSRGGQLGLEGREVAHVFAYHFPPDLEDSVPMNPTVDGEHLLCLRVGARRNLRREAVYAHGSSLALRIVARDHLVVHLHGLVPKALCFPRARHLDRTSLHRWTERIAATRRCVQRELPRPVEREGLPPSGGSGGSGVDERVGGYKKHAAPSRECPRHLCRGSTRGGKHSRWVSSTRAISQRRLRARGDACRRTNARVLVLAPARAGPRRRGP